MALKKNYTEIEELIHQVSNLDDRLCQQVFVLLESLEDITYNYKNNSVEHDRLLALSKKVPELAIFLSISAESVAIDQDKYLVLYVHCLLRKQIGKLESYLQVSDIVKSSNLPQKAHIPSGHFGFVALAYYLILTRPNWATFTSEFDGEDWAEISTLKELIPLARLSIEEVSDWLILIATKQEKDGALLTISEYLKEWVLRFNDIEALEKALPFFVSNNYLRKFLAAIIGGLKERRQLNFRHYWNTLKYHSNSSTTNDILLAVGRLGLSSQEDQADFFQILLENFETGNIRQGELISLCATFNLFEDRVNEIITSGLSDSLDTELVFPIIWYLEKGNKMSPWYKEICQKVFTLTDKRYTYALDSLLTEIYESNSTLAFELLELRMQLTGGINPLKGTIAVIAQNNRQEFQALVLKCLNSDDSRLHLSIRRLSILDDLDSNLFSINKEIFAPLSLSEKLYVAYKISGYVYAREALQHLFISLVKSVDIDSEIFESQIRALLKDYIIYNYRSTLDLLAHELESINLPEFAKRVFSDAVSVYEKYFDALNRLSVKKELAPSKKMVQLKRFYQSKQFEEASEKSEKKGGLSELFGEPILLNSNKWAIRRANESKHVVDILEHVEVSMEYPSGEFLDPHFQEYMRRTYQKVRKHEIDIN